MMSEMDDFYLNFEQARILYSFLFFLIKEDIERETDFQNRQLKRRWLEIWIKSIEQFLQSLHDNKTQVTTTYLFTDYSELAKAVSKLKNNLTKKMPLYLILLELSLFIIYYPLGVEEDDKFKKLTITDTYRQTIIKKLESFADELGIETEYVRRFKSNYKKWNNEISEFNPLNLLLGGLIGGAVVAAVAAAIAIPILVPLLAPVLAPGLSGAAAISAVLAALGGGAIAAGGFGMAGGMVVIVGGGAILGTGVGTGIGSLFAQSPSLIIPQAAKFLVTFNDILLEQKDVIKQVIAMKARQIIKQQRNTINEIEEQISELQMSVNQNEEQVKNLQKLVKFLRKTLDISQNLLKNFLQRHSLS